MGLFVLISGAVNQGVVAIGIGFLMMLGGLILSVLKGQNLRVTRIHNGEAWIAGVALNFWHRSLPARENSLRHG